MDKYIILQGAKKWFAEVIAENHIKNTKKCSNPKNLNINPFTIGYLANFIEGEATAESLAKAVIYPRALGTSLTTSMGSNLQKFISTVLGAFGSTTSGIDIEFIDQIDKRKKYCQLKSGPDTINNDDVDTIHNHFKSVRSIARTNNLDVNLNDLVIGVLYGESKQLNGSYKKLEKQHSYHILSGKDFWHRLTGDENFYSELIQSLSDIAVDYDGREVLNEAIQELSKSDEIQNILKLLTPNANTSS